MASKVSTGQLRAGDEVLVFGATVRLEGKPLAIQAPGRNRTVWTWPNMPIIKGRVDWAPETTMLSIQGGTERQWHVTRRSA